MNSAQRQLYIDAQNFFDGDGGRQKDRRHAVELLRQVCDWYPTTIPSAARMLANCLETAEGAARDLEEARRYYQEIGDDEGVARCNQKIISNSRAPSQRPHAVAAVRNSRPPPPARAASRVAANEARVRPVPRGLQHIATPQRLPSPLPCHIERIVLEDAERNGYVCSISCESVTLQNGAVTSCGHIFERLGIIDWMQKSPECPECRHVFAISSNAAT